MTFRDYVSRAVPMDIQVIAYIAARAVLSPSFSVSALFVYGFVRLVASLLIAP